MPIVQHKRGTRANLETLKTNSQLVVGQLYVITDEGRIAIGTAINAYIDYAKKSETDAKASTSVATTSVNGLMSSTDKTKLDGVATNANNYSHPANHPPSIISQDASNRFVTDTEKSTWNAKQAALVSGTDIKTINSTSLLGAGNINLNDTYYTETEVNSLLSNRVATNTAITGATKTKITYDAKGLVTGGADLANTDMPASIDATKIANGSVSNTEFQYLDGVTSAIQTQLSAKMDALNVTTGTSLTIDFATYNFHVITITGNASFSLSNVPTNKVVTIGVLNTGGGVVTLPNTADYKKAATYTHTANGYIEYSIFYDGTNRFWQVSEEIKA